MQATILHHIEPHLVYKISIVERRSPQYCWPAETVRMHFGKQYGVECYEGALIGVCFPFFSRMFGSFFVYRMQMKHIVEPLFVSHCILVQYCFLSFVSIILRHLCPVHQVRTECFRRVYGLSSAISRHHLWLCSTGFCGPQERKAFPFCSFLRSLSVPVTRSLLGYFCPVL